MTPEGKCTTCLFAGATADAATQTCTCPQNQEIDYEQNRCVQAKCDSNKFPDDRITINSHCLFGGCIDENISCNSEIPNCDHTLKCSTNALQKKICHQCHPGYKLSADGTECMTKEICEQERKGDVKDDYC